MTDKAFITCLWFDTQGEAAAKKVQRVTEAVLTMTKFDIAALQKAYVGG